MSKNGINLFGTTRPFKTTCPTLSTNALYLICLIQRHKQEQPPTANVEIWNYHLANFFIVI